MRPRFPVYRYMPGGDKYIVPERYIELTESGMLVHVEAGPPPTVVDMLPPNEILTGTIEMVQERPRESKRGD